MLKRLILILSGYTPVIQDSKSLFAVKDNQFTVWVNRGLGLDKVYSSKSSKDAYTFYNTLCKGD